jgi:hypothetical protein
MTTRAIAKFEPGDRVAEKPKDRPVLTHNQEVKDRIKAYRSQRYGVVVETIYKRNARGSEIPYVAVIWDHSESPSLHSQNRICLEQDLVAETAAFLGT